LSNSPDIRYDTIRYVRPKADDYNQLSLSHGAKNKKKRRKI